VENSPVTDENPAQPGEIVYVYATGLGVPAQANDLGAAITTGVKYPIGAPTTSPTTASAVSSIAGGKTADVISASLMQGSVGTFKVVLHLNSDIPTNSTTNVTIAQDIYVSNVVTISVVNPNPGQ
jgi:uncharacterized protein (TIGR03437 family)